MITLLFRFALLNSILIRAFFAIHRSVAVEKIIRENIEKEIKKKKLPDTLVFFVLFCFILSSL